MSRSYRDLPLQYANEHQRISEERKRQSIIKKATQESEVLQRIRHERAEGKARKKLLFCLWFMLDTRLRNLEDIRDSNIPQDPDGKLDDQFCNAVREIPELRKACNDLWFAYATYERR